MDRIKPEYAIISKLLVLSIIVTKTHVPYMSVNGSVTYAIFCSCLDISHAINVVSRLRLCLPWAFCGFFFKDKYGLEHTLYCLMFSPDSTAIKGLFWRLLGTFWKGFWWVLRWIFLRGFWHRPKERFWQLLWWDISNIVRQSKRGINSRWKRFHQPWEAWSLSFRYVFDIYFAYLGLYLELS